MRKSISIALTLLLLFNVLGYYGIFVGWQYTHNKSITLRLDAGNYSFEETVTFKVPLALPYHLDNENFERVDGEIEYRGEMYRLAKQKLSNDTLYIVFVKDTHSKTIKNALADYVKNFTDEPFQTSGKNTINFTKDYLASNTSIHCLTGGWCLTITTIFQKDRLKSVQLPVSSPPPKA
jgi:hypothetical protein